MLVKVIDRKSNRYGEMLKVLRSYPTTFGLTLYMLETCVGESAHYSDEVAIVQA